MGAACCVAARDKTIPSASSGEYHNRNARYSPTWSFRWENRGRVAGEDTSVVWLSDGVNSHHDGMDSKLEMTRESDDRGSLDGFQRRSWPKSPLFDGSVGHATTSGSDQPITIVVSMNPASHQVESQEFSACVFPSPGNLLQSSVPSTSSPLTSSSQAHFQHASSTPSRQSNHSRKLLLQVPGSMTRDSKSLRSPSATAERLPIPSWNNESKQGFLCGISDGWSENALTGFVSSSPWGGSSLDGEAMGLTSDKMSKTAGQMSASTSVGLQACGVCLKSLAERSSWSAQKIIANSKLSVVAVLICGHVYHAECLEVMTSDVDKYDPACPVCTLGERQAFETSEKALMVAKSCIKKGRRSRNPLDNSDVSGNLASLSLRFGGDDGKDVIEDSCSATRSTSAKHFFHRHFFFGSKGSRTLTEVHPTKHRGLFWTKLSKE